MLEEYNRKRNFDRTPEPRGTPRHTGHQRFVIQKHKASRLHYDLRLEMDGVLRSWAVPKGPSLDPGEKRLAIQTEDHPVDYGGFEGVIPRGNYGAGQVIVWDRGTYEMVDPATPEEGWAKQKFHVTLSGEKLAGEWVLVRTGRGENEWLFFKVRDEFASGSDIVRTRPESVVSGLKVEDLGKPGVLTRTWNTALERQLEGLGIKAADRTRMPALVSPMLPTLTSTLVEGDEWVYELKLDGVRAIASRDGDRVELWSRNQNALGDRFPALLEAIRSLEVDSAILDGEIVAFDERGRTRFSLLQPYLHSVRGAKARGKETPPPVWFSAFDLLYVNGFDLTGSPLVDRKSILRTLIPNDGWVRYTDHIEGDASAFFAMVEAHGLEGIVAKKKTSRYHQGRSRSWLKLKTARTEDFVVMGFTPPAGARHHLGALVLGQFDNGRLVYVGRVGSGIDDKALEEAYSTLAELARPTPLVSPAPRELARTSWVEPVMVVEVRFSEWTKDGKLRAPVFLRFRDDVAPLDCGFHRAAGVDTAGAASSARAPEGRSSPGPGTRDGVDPGVAFTNVDKIFYPKDGITKGDLIAYYSDIEATLAPYLQDRPLVLKRYPDGITGEYFYQKDAPAHRPDWVRTQSIWSPDTEREIHYIVGCEAGLLPYLANLGGITQNPWSSRVGRLDRPDYVIFDLDPTEGTPFSIVRKVALELGKVLDELELRAYPKTSGASGIHVCLPLLEDAFTYAEVRTFAEAIASVVVRRSPGVSTIERAVSRRPKGTVYIDYLQNARGQTVASVYSPRARAGAPVSMPIRWEELRRAIDPTRYHIRNTFRRLARVGDLFRPVLEDGQDIRPFLQALGG